jgi:hypothetical protein
MQTPLKVLLLTTMTASLLLGATLPASAESFAHRHPRRAQVK